MRLHVDSRGFQRTLREYLTFTRRDIARVVNEKCHYVARTAVRLTPRASRAAIRRAWRQPVTVRSADGRSSVAPLGAIVTQKRLAQKGPGYGPNSARWAEFKLEVKRGLGRRYSAIGYMAAGWLAAAKQLARAAHLREPEALRKRNVKWSKIGGAIPATSGWKPIAEIWNAAIARRTRDPRTKLERIAGQAVSRAMAQEMRGMQQYMERKLREGGRRYLGRALR